MRVFIAQEDGAVFRYETTVGDQALGYTLMKAMRRAWPMLPEQAFREALKKKDILVNQVRLNANIQVTPGDKIVIYTRHAMRDIPIIFEDDRFLIVNKPAGLNTDRHPGSRLTLISWAEARSDGGYQPQLCHRLDNQTSGLCLLAKDDASAEMAKAAFKAREVIKVYECLVRGTPKPPAAVLRAWLSKDAQQARVSISDLRGANSREILTGYQVTVPGDIARLEVRLITGRTHQIRAHLAHLGHPILGDDIYGDRAFNRAQGQPGLKLCAVSLAFPDECGVESLRGRTFRVPAPF